MRRTKFFGIKPATKSQFDYIANLLRICKARGEKQQVSLDSFNKHTGRIVLNNFFLAVRDRARVWDGYKVILFADGSVVMDKEFLVKQMDGGLFLVRPEELELAKAA